MAAGHLVAALLSPSSSPVLAVGSTVIDLTPTPLKEYAVREFGTKDKAILVGSVMAVTLLLAALAGALAAGVPLEDAVAGIEAAERPERRMQMHRIAGDITVIDDSFNATLDSVLGALDALASFDAPERVAVLGPLRDGIAYLDEIHAIAREHAETLGIEILAYKAPIYGVPVVEHRRRLRQRVDSLPPGSAVLIKGSHHDVIDEVVAELIGKPGS